MRLAIQLVAIGFVVSLVTLPVCAEEIVVKEPIKIKKRVIATAVAPVKTEETPVIIRAPKSASKAEVPPKEVEIVERAPVVPKTRELDPREVFARGNNLYEVGRYEEAVKEYEKLLRLGYRSGNLYYNLGNAFFKLDQNGRAVLYYENALRMQPRDQDLRSNLDYALSLIEDRVEPPQKSWAVRQLDGLVNSFNLREFISVAVVLYWLLFALLIAFVYAREWRRPVLRMAVVNLLLLILVVALAFSRAQLDRRERAVILAKEVNVRYGPSSNDVVAFVLHEGSVVGIKNEKAGWYQISLPDGKSGWMKKEDCGLI